MRKTIQKEIEKEIIHQKFKVNIDHCPDELCIALRWKLNTAFALLLQLLSGRNTVD